MIYVITGQTATGKTKRALQLAKDHHGELINCDSRQMYKGLDVITGKDLSLTDGKFQKVTNLNTFDIGYYGIGVSSRLWLYDIVTPEQPFSAFEYRLLVLEVLKDIESRGKTAIIIGGTYFYLQHLLYNILDTPVPPNPQLRESLGKESTSQLQHMLFTKSPQTYKVLNNSEQHNRQRLIRKIEVLEAGNTVATPQDEEYEYAPPFSEENTVIEGYHFEDRNKQHQIIKQRIETRLTEGAIEEVKQLLAAGYTGTEPGLQSLGYKEIIAYINNTLSFDEMKKEWLTREMQYAKRQYTFTKRDPHISWIEV